MVREEESLGVSVATMNGYPGFGYPARRNGGRATRRDTTLPGRTKNTRAPTE